MNRLLITTIAGALAVQSTAFAQRIIGGNDVTPDQSIAASAVSLSTSTVKAFCSRVLIHPSAILTAAHCVKGRPVSTLAVTFGLNGTTTPLYRGAYQVYIPKQYDEYASRLPNVKNAYDIAIVIFSGSLPRGYKPALMVKDAAVLHTGDAVEVGGFGMSNSAGSAGVLRTCLTTVLNPAYSTSELQLNASSRCAPAGGDSGGPMFRVGVRNNVYLYGLTIWGWHNDDGSPLYGIHTRVATYYPWIMAVLLNPTRR
ncbi:MAG: trypsin-like serine protease [Bdellovibrionales bacterium]|nr:trypsin-like serine protease [Bdellovibrionales bacterium]